MSADRDLAPGEWAVLALLSERPGHGWALAKHFSSSGELGSVWRMGRPLVYRSLDVLEQRALVEAAGQEPGRRGPHRTIYRATPAGLEALERWLREPVAHVRDARSLLLLKLVIASRLRVDARPILDAELETISASERALEERAASASGAEQILLRFRLESTRAVLRFIDGMRTERAAREQAV